MPGGGGSGNAAGTQAHHVPIVRGSSRLADRPSLGVAPERFENAELPMEVAQCCVPPWRSCR